MKRFPALDLTSALDVRRGDLVSLVGGGGKTSLMYRLTRELREKDVRTGAATTTKIAPPGGADPGELVCAAGYEELVAALGRRAAGGLTPVLGSRLLENGKVEGIPPEWCDRLVLDGVFDTLVVEADGAARRPLKAPEAWEPVVPEKTTLFVPVVGLSCVGQPLGEAIVFRSTLAAAVASVPLGAPVTEEVVATLLTAPSGLGKGRPAGARVAVVLNQADSEEDQERGRRIAESVLDGWDSCERVVTACLRRADAVKEVWVR